MDWQAVCHQSHSRNLYIEMEPSKDCTVDCVYSNMLHRRVDANLAGDRISRIF